MANPEYLEILKKRVRAWNKWRRDNPELQIDLSEANLKGRQLSGVNFHQVTLIKANFSHANLEKADFNSADLLSTNLKKANLISLNLNSAELFFRLDRGESS